MVLKNVWCMEVIQIESSNQTLIEKLRYALMISMYDSEHELINYF